MGGSVSIEEQDPWLDLDLSDGEDYYCETCGPSWDAATISWDSEAKGFEIVVSLGCYSGGSAYGLKTDEAIAFVEEQLHAFPTQREEAINWIKWQVKP